VGVEQGNCPHNHWYLGCFGSNGGEKFAAGPLADFATLRICSRVWLFCLESPTQPPVNGLPVMTQGEFFMKNWP
jgi:hypothetical protein